MPVVLLCSVSGKGTTVRPVMLFVKRTTYKKRFDFYGVASKVVAEQWVGQVRDSVDALNVKWLNKGKR